MNPRIAEFCGTLAAIIMDHDFAVEFRPCTRTRGNVIAVARCNFGLGIERTIGFVDIMQAESTLLMAEYIAQDFIRQMSYLNGGKK